VPRALELAVQRERLLEFSNLAMAEFEQALALDRELEGAWHGIGRVHGQNDRLGPAFAAFSQELLLHPDNAEAQRDTGFVFFTWNRWPDALQHFRTADVLGLQDAPMFAAMARIEIDTNFKALPPQRVNGTAQAVWDNPRGLADAYRALELDRTDPMVLEYGASALYANDRFEEAFELLEELAKLVPWRANELKERAASYRIAQALRQPPAPEAPSAEPGLGAPDTGTLDPGTLDPGAPGSAVPGATAPATEAPPTTVPAPAVPPTTPPGDGKPESPASPPPASPLPDAPAPIAPPAPIEPPAPGSPPGEQP